MRNSRLIPTVITLIILALIIGQQTKSSERDLETRKWSQDLPTGPGTVKIIPLGSHAGEFCRNDRSIMFEDPTGVRVLWDPGRTVDESDARLGVIHAVLLSSAHGDHLGDTKPNPNSPGSCATPGTISAAPHSTTAAIAAAQNAAVFAGGEMSDFLGRKIQNIRGASTASCAASGPDNELIVPLIAPCVGTLRPGGSRTLKLQGASTGVRVANFQAHHSNGIPAGFVDSPGVAPGTTAYGGNDGGAVIRFSNGLTVYLTADTGVTGDMETIIRRFYGADLVVINMGDVFSMGPEEAAFAINTLLKPRTVIPSHINEAATSGGLMAGARLQRFSQMLDRRGADIVLPLSGVTREFDGHGRCLNCKGQ